MEKQTQNPKKNPKSDEVPEKNEKIEKLIEAAFPVTYAKFHAAVDNGDKTPENYFSEESDNSSRRVQMWASYAFLICLHKGKYFCVPLSNVIFCKAK